VRKHEIQAACINQFLSTSSPEHVGKDKLLQFIARHWRDIRDLGHGRLEFLAIATLRAPLKFPEILEGTCQFLELPQRERIDRLMAV